MFLLHYVIASYCIVLFRASGTSSTVTTYRAAKRKSPSPSIADTRRGARLCRAPRLNATMLRRYGPVHRRLLLYWSSVVARLFASVANWPFFG